MRRPRWRRALAFALLLAAAAADRAAAGDARLLWQIGKADNDTAELALGPGGFREFGRDGFFVVGRSDPRRDWPYCHPGPSDSWAGARPHTFTILFGLSKQPAAACRPALDPATLRTGPRLGGTRCAEVSQLRGSDRR